MPPGAALDETQPRVSLVPVFLVVLVDVFGMTLVLPLLAIYAETFDASALQASLLVSAYAICQLASGPIIGHWSDRIGRKPMLVVSQIGTCLGFIMLARAHALWVIYLSRILDGATAGNLSLAQAYIADHTRPEDRTKAFGLIGMAFGIGLFIGPGVTGLLSARYGLTAPIWAAASLSFLSIVTTLVLLRNDAPSASAGAHTAMLSWRTYAAYFGRPELRGRLLQFLCFVLAFSTFLSGFALFAERRFTWHGRAFGPREIGLVFCYLGFVGIVMQVGVLGRLVKRFGDRALIVGGLTLLVAGFGLLGLSHSIAPLLVAVTLLAAANGMLRPALTSVITQQAQRHEQGTLAGITASLVALASVVSPFVGGTLIERNDLTSWAWVAAALALAGLFIVRAAGPRAPAPTL